MKQKQLTLITDEDKKVWLEFVSSINKFDEVTHHSFFASSKIRVKILVRNISPRLDLHGFTIAEAYKKLLLFLERNYLFGRKKVLIITGKGKPDNNETLNKLVPRWLQEKPMRDIVRSYKFLEKNPGELEITFIKH